jgi:hypothetical protein
MNRRSRGTKLSSSSLEKKCQHEQRLKFSYDLKAPILPSSTRVYLQDYSDLSVTAARRNYCLLAQVINFLEWRSLHKRDRDSVQELPNTCHLWSETSKHNYNATKTRKWRRGLNSCRISLWNFAFVYRKTYCWCLRLESCCSLIHGCRLDNWKA